nr:MAG TPA: hypothetical protein [Caudoviricetes sp.]
MNETTLESIMQCSKEAMAEKIRTVEKMLEQEMTNERNHA